MAFRSLGGTLLFCDCKPKSWHHFDIRDFWNWIPARLLRLTAFRDTMLGRFNVEPF